MEQFHFRRLLLQRCDRTHSANSFRLSALLPSVPSLNASILCRHGTAIEDHCPGSWNGCSQTANVLLCFGATIKITLQAMRHALHIRHDFSGHNTDGLAPAAAPSLRPWTCSQSCIDSIHLFLRLHAQPLPCLAAYLS